MENKFDSDVDNSTVFRGIASDGTVAKKFEVGYSDVDKNLRLRPYTALDFCQNTAVFHSDLAGFDLDYFIENERAWIIKGWCASFDHLPGEGTSVKVSTWTAPYKRLQASRSFCAEDENGNKLFEATSRWFLMNSKRRRPTKISDEFFGAYIPSEKPMLFPDFDYEIHSPMGYNFISTAGIRVTMRDIDMNDHVNNISYVIWGMDALPDEVHDSTCVKHIETVYLHEATKDDDVFIDVYCKDSDVEPSLKDYLSIIRRKDDEEHIFVSVKFTVKDNFK